MKQKLTNVAETMLIPLWARAEETKKENPIIIDKKAVEMVSEIDYDFSKFEKSWMSQVGCAIRAEILDTETKKFIRKNPNAIIVNLGCGLDTRFSRMDNGKIKWYDLDLPEPIRIKKHFFMEESNYKMIAKSVFDYSWLEEIKEANRPVLIIAEGLFMYFTENEIKELMKSLIKKFPNAEMLLEILPPIIAKNSKKHDSLKKVSAEFKWGLKTGKDLEKINPKIKFIEEFNYFDFHKKRWKWFGMVSMIPWIKNNMSCKIVKVGF